MVRPRLYNLFVLLACLTPGLCLADDVEVTILDGGTQRPQGLAGASISLVGSPTVVTTDVNGQASLASVPAGLQTIEITGPVGFSTLRLPVEVSSGALELRPVVLTRLPSGIADVTTTTGGVVDATTSVEDPLVPNARVQVEAGRSISGVSTSTPALAIYPVDPSLNPSPHYALQSRRLYQMHPNGLAVAGGVTVRLPNDENLPPGEQADLYSLLPTEGGWAQVGTATVDATGAYLEADTASITTFTLISLQTRQATVTTTTRLVVQDAAGAPITSATVSLNGWPLPQTTTPGTYEGVAIVATNTPVRALVSVNLGGGLQLSALTDPVFPIPELTELHGGQPLVLGLQVSGGGGAGGSAGGTAGAGYALTDGVFGSHSTGGAGGTAGTYTSWSGPLNNAFPQPPNGPGVSFSLLPPGTDVAPTTSQVLTFGLQISDADTSDRLRIVSVKYSTDGGSTYPHTASLSGGDPLSPLSVPQCGGSKFLFAWDTLGGTLPTSVASGAQELKLQVTVEDVPSGITTQVESDSFYHQYPSVEIARTSPADGAVGVFIDHVVTIDFAQPMDGTSVAANVELREGVSQVTTATFTYDSEAQRATMSFSSGSGLLHSDRELTIVVGGSTASANGMTFGSDQTFTFHTTSIAGLADDDGDGLLNVEETALGTGTNDSDSDDDGLSDWHELYVSHTDPNNADSDGDGTNDSSDPTPLGDPDNPQPTPDIASVGTFSVTATFPAHGATVAANTSLAVTFTNPVDVASVDSSNVTLYDQTAMASVNLEVASSSPSPRTLSLTPSTALVSGRSYLLTVTTGAGAIEDTASSTVAALTTSVFTIGTPTTADYEATKYLSSLRRTQWEVFPLPAPTAGGRNGMALAVPTTGKLLLQETDVVTPGRQIPVAITRTYRNNDTAASGIFGKNWHFTYDRRFSTVASVDTDSTYELRFRSGDGRTFDYLSNDNSKVAADYFSPPGFYDTLRTVTIGSDKHLRQRTGTGTEFFYAFHRPNNTTFEDPDDLPSDAVGYLVRIRDRNGNTIHVNRYSPNHSSWPNQIEEIVDDLERTTTFTYPESGNTEWVTKIEQFEEDVTRSWTYSYSANGELLTVSTPTSDWLDEGAAKSGVRKTRTYTYQTSGSTYLLTSILDGRGNTSFRAVYDGSDDVIQIDYGSGVDAGTAIYTYVRTGSENVATQVDRNGNVLTLTHEVGASSSWTIQSAVLPSQGYHPNQSSYPGGVGEPAEYVTLMGHDSDSELVSLVDPSERVTCWIRNECGCPVQVVEKSALWSAILADAEAGMEDDRVIELGYDHSFHQLRYLIDPRGNSRDFVQANGNPFNAIILDREDVEAQTMRTFNPEYYDADAREYFTTHVFYDHDDVTTLMAGMSWSFDRTFIQSYGRTSATGPYQEPVTNGIFSDDDNDGFPDKGGNPIAVRGPQPQVIDPTTCAFKANRQALEWSFAYNQYGQKIMEVEPDGDRNRFEYYTGTFNASTAPNAGYLRYQVTATSYLDTDLTLTTGVPSGSASGSGLELVTELAYDVFGNVTSAKNPRGFTTTIEVNHLNLVTKTTAPAPFSYERRMTYDGNNNLVEAGVQNVVALDADDDGIQGSANEQQIGTVPEFVHRYVYNTANSLAQSDMDAAGSDPGRLVTTYVYDRKQLRVATREPAGNLHFVRYDERDLIYESISGYSDSLTATTTKYDYDGSRNLLQVIDDDGNSNADQVITYDSFNRPVTVTDEIGNTVTSEYDVANQLTRRFVTGQATGASAEPVTTILANTVYTYDAAKRVVQSAQELWGTHATLASMSLTRLTAPVDVTGQRKNSGELAHHLYAYDEDGKLISECDDNVHVTDYEYDAADRLTKTTDDEGSDRRLTYDKGSNVIRIQDHEVPATTGSAEDYYTEFYYDQLDRLVARVSNLGNTTRFLYDSRNNVVQTSDANGTTSGGPTLTTLDVHSEHGSFPQGALSLNVRGNTTTSTYDGLSRLLSTTEHLRSDGTGGTSAIGQIKVSQNWDANSRVAARFDPRGNVTAYAYDHQNRLIRELFADNTSCRYTYNKTGTLAVKVDPRGVTDSYTYDAAERRITRSVQNVPTGQGQTTFAAWQWDGLDRQSKAEDDDTICEYAYDSLSRQISDTQGIGTGAPRSSSAQALNGEVTGYQSRAYDGVGNLLRQWYPSDHNGSGGRTGTPITRTYDGVDRQNQVSADSVAVATFEHIGMGLRRVNRAYGTPDVTQHLDYDGDRRVTRLDARVSTGGQRIRGFTYAWDRVGNRRYERRLNVNTTTTETNGVGEFYTYDSAYRLREDQQDVASATLDLVTNNVASPTAPTAVLNSSTTYHLDSAGNRTQTRVDGALNTYVSQWNNPVADAPMNQYTQIGSTFRSHDAAGNVSGEGGTQRFFDADNRLVQWTEGSKDVRYRYDAGGRRVMKEDPGSSSFATVLYFYDGWQCVEETNSSGTLTKAYVYGEGIDEVLRATLPEPTGVDIDGDMTTGESAVDVYYHHNSLGSVVAVTNASGSVRESYRYASYGAPKIFDESDTEISATKIEQPWLFTGRRWDFEEGSGLYYYRLRYYDPEAGRFISRDPLGNWGDPSQRGNAQNYCGNNPVNYVDPMGDRDAKGTFGDRVASRGAEKEARARADARYDSDKSKANREFHKKVGDIASGVAEEILSFGIGGGLGKVFIYGGRAYRSYKAAKAAKRAAEAAKRAAREAAKKARRAKKMREAAEAAREKARQAKRAAAKAAATALPSWGRGARHWAKDMSWSFETFGLGPCGAFRVKIGGLLNKAGKEKAATNLFNEIMGRAAKANAKRIRIDPGNVMNDEIRKRFARWVKRGHLRKVCEGGKEMFEMVLKKGAK